MSEKGHTQGPWVISRKSESSCKARINAVGWGHLAKVVVRMEGSPSDSPEGIANARLIASAPELLDALKHIARVLDRESYPENGSLESNLGSIARNAIAKANAK